MEIKINPEQIQAAIQSHLDRVVKEGIDYRVKEAINTAIADAITPEVVAGYAEAAVKALTDPGVTQRIVEEMHAAISEAARLTMQEAIVSVASKLRGYNLNRNRDDTEKIEELREKLFPSTGSK